MSSEKVLVRTKLNSGSDVRNTGSPNNMELSERLSPTPKSDAELVHGIGIAEPRLRPTAPLAASEETEDTSAIANNDQPRNGIDDALLGDHDNSRDDTDHLRNSSTPGRRDSDDHDTLTVTSADHEANGAVTRIGDDHNIEIPDLVIADTNDVNVNVYQQKKNLAQGMMDLALLSANANQLRYVLESPRNAYFVYSLVGISLSIIFQIAVGVGLILNSRYDVNKHDHICKADKINNFTVIGIFLVTIINVFITSFGPATIVEVR